MHYFVSHGKSVFYLRVLRFRFHTAGDSKSKCKNFEHRTPYSSLLQARGSLSGGGGQNRPQERTAAVILAIQNKKGDRSLPEIN